MSEIKITNTEWLDDTTFLVNFSTETTFDEGEEFNVEVVAEWHKDENKWVYQRQWFTLDGHYIDYEDLADCKSPYEQAIYHTMAEEALKDYYKGSNGSSTSWDDIVVADGYEKYDALIDSIRDYYAPIDDEKAYEVEDFCHNAFADLLHQLDEKFKK